MSPLVRCFVFANWQDNFHQDVVAGVRAFLVTGGPDQQVITDQTFSQAGAKQALRVERITTERAKDGSQVRLHGYERHFLRNDNVAVGFAVAGPADHGEACQAEQILATCTMKAPPGA